MICCRWIGWKSIINHRSGVKGVTLMVMMIEAIVVMIRGTSHFRVTRSLRVLFVVDTHFCRGGQAVPETDVQELTPHP